MSASFKTFIGWVSLLLLLGLPLLFVDKSMPSLWLNNWHSPITDILMKYITYLGSGYVYMPLLILFFVRDKKIGCLFAISIVLQFLLVSVLLKEYLFADALRPMGVIPNFESLNLVEGVKNYRFHSFPSGHSQTAFLCATFGAYLSKDSWVGFLLGSLAAFVALSRVYIFQHFFIDIWFGSLIGLLLSVAILLWWSGWKRNKENS